MGSRTSTTPCGAIELTPSAQLMLNVFTTTLLSGKTGRKVVQCRSLTELASHLGSDTFTSYVVSPRAVHDVADNCDRIEFPPSAYFANAAVEESISLPKSSGDSRRVPKMFGVPLEQVSSLDIASIPILTFRCRSWINQEVCRELLRTAWTCYWTIVSTSSSHDASRLI